MSGSVSDLSPAGIYELGADLRALGHKTGLGWLSLAGHLRRFGSIPSDERSVASILGVTVRFMRERAWPLLEDRLTLSDDGRRYTCPDITPWNGRQRTAARAPDRGVVKSPQQQNAANIRWGKKQQPDAHPKAHADASEPHAETHVISMRGASETHAETHSADAPFASSDASGASTLAHARALSPSGTSLPESPDKWRDSLGEREDAPMRADAPTHASGMRSDAETHASTDAPASEPQHASRHRQQPTSRPSAPIPPDWKPTPEDALAARGRGFDPDELTQGFLNWYLGREEVSPDWNARFRTWMRREKSPPSGNLQQGTIKLPIEGGASEEADDPAAAVGDSAEAQWVRATRKLKAEIGAVPYRTWLSKATVVGIEDGEATISPPSAFLRDYVRNHYLDRLTAFWRADNPLVIRVQAVVASVERRAAGD